MVWVLVAIVEASVVTTGEETAVAIVVLVVVAETTCVLVDATRNAKLVA
jgi:hypothetical protein